MSEGPIDPFAQTWAGNLTVSAGGNEGDDAGRDESLPERYGRYRILGRVGEGGVGAVYLGYDDQLERKVAIKVPRVQRMDSQHDIEKALREARNLAQLRHAGIVTVFDVGLEDGICYIVSDLLEGQSLEEWLRRNAPDWRTTAIIVAAVADALAHAHARSTVHRDIKPGNIILGPDLSPVLVDFGLAVSEEHAASVRRGTVSGTPSFMSPEQAAGQAHRIDGRTDIYSLGVVLYLMLCGRPPFRAKNYRELLRQITEDEPQPPRQLAPQLPREVEAICLRAMAKDLNRRYTTAGDLAEDLRALLSGGEAAPAPSTPGATTMVAEETEPAVEAPPPPATAELSLDPERRRVTLLYCGCVLVAPGSGSMEGLDPEEQAELLGEFYASAEGTMEQFAGTVVQSTGNDMLVCFGYPMGYEHSAQSAVRAGLKMLQAAGAMNRSIAQRNIALQATIAVHTGMAVVGGSGPDSTGLSIVGDTSRIVTRLETVVEPGTLAISGATHKSVGGFFECESLGARSIRGLSEPIEIYRVLREGAAKSRLDLVAPTSFTPLVGREQEVGLLHDRWQRAKEGMGQLVLLAGEAGIGKSRLVHDLTEHAVRDVGSDLPVVQWRCSTFYRNTELHPATEYFEQMLGFERDETPESRRDKLEAHLQSLGLEPGEALPLLASMLGIPASESWQTLDLTPHQQKEKTLDTLSSWLFARARRQPVLFVAEDLHWIDATSLELLSRLADQPIVDPILILLTFRPEFTPPWSARVHHTQVGLNRLSAAQIGAMVEARTGLEDLPHDFVRHIADRTDGVPLFVEEVTQMLLESDAVETKDGIVRLVGPFPEHAIPDTLQDLLVARLDRMAGNAEVVQLAATLGREFTFEMLQAASAMPEAELAGELSKLTSAEFLFQKGWPPSATYLFKHVLIQDAAYASMLKKRRQDFHARIADVLLQRFPEIVEAQPELQAYHYTEAGDIEPAIDYWEKAGRRSHLHSAHPEAIGHLSKALQLLRRLEDTPERDRREYALQALLGVSTLSVQGYAYPQLGKIYERIRELADKMDDPTGRVYGAWFMSSWRIVRDEMDICRRLADEILELARRTEDDGLLMEAHFISNIVHFYRGELEDAFEHGVRGMALDDFERVRHHAHHTGQNAAVAHLSYLALSLWHLGHPEQGRERLEQALQLAERLEDHPFSTAFALHHAGWWCKTCRLGDEALAHAERQIDVSREQGFVFWQTTGRLYHGAALIELGRHAEGVAEMTESMQHYIATGAELGLPYYYAWLAEGYIGSGDADAALATLDKAIAAVEKSNERFQEAEVRRLRGEALLLRSPDDVAEAQACFEASRRVAAAQSARGWELRTAISQARLHRRRDGGAEAVDELRRILDGFDEGHNTADLKDAAKLTRESS